jgi:hypothetical protein
MTPGTAKPGAWFPSLKGTDLPTAAINGIEQGFTLLYALRDSVTQLQQSTAKLVQYGTKQDRQQANAQALADGALWVETDTHLIYQVRMDPKSTSKQWTAV